MDINNYIATQAEQTYFNIAATVNVAQNGFHILKFLEAILLAKMNDSFKLLPLVYIYLNISYLPDRGRVILARAQVPFPSGSRTAMTSVTPND